MKKLFCTMVFICCVILAVSLHEIQAKKIKESNEYYETLEKRKIELTDNTIKNSIEDYKTRNRVVFIRTEESSACPKGKEYVFKDDREQLYKMCNTNNLNLTIGNEYYYKGGWTQ